MRRRSFHQQIESSVSYPVQCNPFFVRSLESEQVCYTGKFGTVVIGCQAHEVLLDDWFVFKALVDQWRVERGARSSITEGAMCAAYQNIIGMGEKAISRIIAQLRSEGDDPDQWFWALQAITRENPVPEGAQGDYRTMAKAWLEWAEREGYAR